MVCACIALCGLVKTNDIKFLNNMLGAICMRPQFLAFLLLMTLGLGILKASGEEQTNKTERLTVHGRLTYYNGNPSSRIWIVGTKRLLGIRESGDEVAYMPKELRDLMSWDREIFADFVVEPLTPYKQGGMQMVRVVSASKIVVTEKDKIILRKDKP
jgi:hypothetical protein